MLTWKEFVYIVETKLSNNGIDINKQPIEIDWIDISGPDFGKDKYNELHVNINTKYMPDRVYMSIS